MPINGRAHLHTIPCLPHTTHMDDFARMQHQLRVILFLTITITSLVIYTASADNKNDALS